MQDLAHRAYERHVGFLDAVGQVVPKFPERMHRKRTTVFEFAKETLLPEWQEAKEAQRQSTQVHQGIVVSTMKGRPKKFWQTLVFFLQNWNIAVQWVESGFEATFSSWSKGENLDGFSLGFRESSLKGFNLMPLIDIPELRGGDDVEEWMELIRCQARSAQGLAHYGDLPDRRKNKLELSDDLTILACYQVGGESQITLASRYGVSQGQISKLLHRTAAELNLTLNGPRDITLQQSS